jgi:GAF domain-containing protein
MRRRSSAGGKSPNAQDRKTAARKGRIARKSARRRSLAGTQETELAHVIRERDEAREQQTATADVLKIISRSTFDLKEVLNTLTVSAARLCAGDKGLIFQRDGDVLRLVANLGHSREAEQYWLEHPLLVDGGSATGRAVLEGRAIHIPDVLADPNYQATRYQELSGYRSVLCVPLLRNGTTIGTFSLSRDEVTPFTDRQIKLVETFADQAVIAIENTRLFEAEQKRTRELTESLERQTATSEVLKVISRSPSDLQPVFEAMLENAVRLCDAKFGNICRWRDGALHLVAAHNTPPALVEARRRLPLVPGQHPITDRMVTTKTASHVIDAAATSEYIERTSPGVIENVELGGVRTTLAIPMARENELIGSFTVYRQEVRPFTDKQIELVTNFAAQAVIAIENARLLNELRESLEQQTATSDVLRVISSSPSDIQPVLETIGERAEKLCNAEISVVSIVDDELIRVASIHGMTEAGVESSRRSFPMRPTDETVTARAIRTRSVCHVADVLSDPKYQRKDNARISGFRGCLGVPMIRDEQVVGAIFVARRQPGLFSDTQVQLLKTFADQAVIAIENVRLFKETKTALEQQTATADVLKLISRSTFDLPTVLQTLVESAARFCDADKANIIREKDGVFYTAEAYGYSREFLDYMRNIPIKAERGSASGRALVEGRVVHIADAAADPEYTLVEARRLGDYRTILCVPMLREGVPIGLLVLTRAEVQPFTDKQIELVTTYADQAAIAIENMRLFESEQDRTRELTKSLEDLRTVTALSRHRSSPRSVN